MPKLQDDSDLTSNSKEMSWTAAYAGQLDARGVRRSQRFRMRQYIQCTTHAYGGVKGQMVNVSEAGVLLLCDNPIALNNEEQTSILMTVVVPPTRLSKEGNVRIEAIPVWCNRLASGDQYQIGFKWRHLSVPKRLMIKHWQKYCADRI